MRHADPDQPIHQVVVVRQSSGCLRAFVIGVLIVGVLGYLLVRMLNANDAETRPLEDILAAGTELDESFKAEAKDRGGAQPSEDWLPQVRKRFLNDPTAKITTGKSPDDNLLLIRPDAGVSYACYDLRKIPKGYETNSSALSELTAKPAC